MRTGCALSVYPAYVAETNYDVTNIDDALYITGDQTGLCGDNFVVRICANFDVPTTGVYNFQLMNVDDIAIVFVSR